MRAYSSRRAVAVLSCSLLVGGVAGCGSSGDSGGSSGGGSSASGTDPVALLNDAKLAPSGQVKSLTAGLTVSGKVETPKDDSLRKLDGKVAVTISADKLSETAGSVPPVKVTFDVDGSYTTGNGKSGTAKYSGGVSYLNDQLYVNWKGKDYAFGTELTKQFAQGFTQGLKKEAGSTDDLKKLTQDPAKLAATLDLEPGTWLTDAKVSDGPRVDGTDTYEVTGQIDIKAAATDLSEGFKKLPAAYPDVPGLKELENMGDIKDADVAKAEKSLTTRNLTAIIGKDDKLIRTLKVDLAGTETDKGRPTDIDLSIQIDLSKINQPQGIEAPKNAAPVTDLFSELQKDFPGIGGLLA